MGLPQIVKIEGEEEERLRKAYPIFYEEFGFVRLQPGNFLIPGPYVNTCESFYNFKVRPDDVFVITTPKAGTTWSLEVCWLLMNNCDFESAKQILQRDRTPYLEERIQYSKKYWYGLKDNDTSAHVLDSAPSPRIIKTHLPLACLPPNLLDTCKVLFVTRNPKDMSVSGYHYHKLVGVLETPLDFDEFIEYFMRSELMYLDFWYNVLDCWGKRHHPNLHFVMFEDLKSDLKGEISKVAAHLGKQLTPDLLTKLEEHLSFESIKNNPAVNKQEMQATSGPYKKEGGFMRKGSVGDWKNYFSPELSERFDKWIAERTAHSDIKFRYEI